MTQLRCFSPLSLLFALILERCTIGRHNLSSSSPTAYCHQKSQPCTCCISFSLRKHLIQNFKTCNPLSCLSPPSSVIRIWYQIDSIVNKDTITPFQRTRFACSSTTKYFHPCTYCRLSSYAPVKSRTGQSYVMIGKSFSAVFYRSRTISKDSTVNASVFNATAH